MEWSLDELEARREGCEFEAKKAGGREGKGALPVSFWESYSAMANTRGGCIVLGVAERADTRLRVVGIKQPEAVVTDLWNLLNNPQKVSVNLLREDDVQTVHIDGHAIVVVDVPIASRTDKPVYVGGNPLTGTYMRRNDGDYRLPKDRVQRMFGDADTSRPRDSAVLPNFGEDDLDPATIAAFRNLFSARHPDHPFLLESGVAFLEKLRLWGHDRESGATGLRVAGLLLFGKESAILEVFPHFHVDYRDERGEHARWQDRIFPDGTWNANLLQFYWRAVRRLHEDLPVPFALDENMVRAGETPVHRALREALVNALIHTDYRGERGIVVARDASRFEFRNPGLLLVPEAQARSGGDSQCRNPGYRTRSPWWGSPRRPAPVCRESFKRGTSSSGARRRSGRTSRPDAPPSRSPA